MGDSDDDTPQLSAQAVAALHEFYQEQIHLEQNLNEAALSGDVEKFKPQENWQLSQFWYDEATAELLAKEALSVAGTDGRIACISCPTAYKKIRELKGQNVQTYCLEYDDRFKVFGEDFVFYDYNKPLQLPAEFKNSFDIVLADPPFLSEECLCQIAVTIRYLTKRAIMTELANRLLGVKSTHFLPGHTSGLQNEFCCFINYESTLLNKTD